MKLVAQVNGKVADDSIWIQDHQVQTGWVSASAPDLFPHICRFTGDDRFLVQRKLWSTSILSKNSRGGYYRICKKGD